MLVRAMRARQARMVVAAAALAYAAALPACTALVDWDTIHEDEVAGRTDGGADAPIDVPGSDQPYVAQVLAAKPIAYYRFEEASGDRVENVVGGAFPGTLRGGTTRTDGAVGRGVQLDGVDGRLDLGDSFAFVEDQTRSWSVELVVRVDRVDGDYARIYSREGKSGSDRTGVTLFSHDDVAGFQRMPGGGRTAMGTFTAEPLATGRFLHLVTTCDPELCRLYVDGTRVGGNGNAAGSSAPSGVADSFVVGSSSLGANALRGVLDEVAVYEVALGADVVAAHRRALP